MAVNKISMVLLLLLFAVATVANARLHSSVVPFLGQLGKNKDITCTCDCSEDEGGKNCTFSMTSPWDVSQAVFPNTECICTLMLPLEANTCICAVKVKSCGVALESIAVAAKVQIGTTV